MARFSHVVWAALVLVTVSTASAWAADRPADGLLRLAPPDASAALVVEGLRDHAREAATSPFLARLKALPAFKAWVASGAPAELRKSRESIENILGTDLQTVRDELLGDAVVLAIRLPAGAAPDEARGLLMAKARDAAMLKRLIDRLNDAERGEGTLAELATRKRGAATYSVRRFRAGTKADEFYAVLDDGTFLWSNEESLVVGALDRRGDGAGLLDEPKFRKVRDGLPARALATLYVDPRFLEQLGSYAPPKADRPRTDEMVASFARRYLAATDALGAAVEWRGGPILHVHEVVEPARLDPALKRWAARNGSARGLLGKVPETALIVAAGLVDPTAVGDGLLALVTAEDAEKAGPLLDMLRGLLLDKDPRTEVLPRLGPGVVAYVDVPAEKPSRPSLVVAVAAEGNDEPTRTARAAVANGLRTLFSFAALDGDAAKRGRRVETRTAAGATVTSLAGETPLAFAVTGDAVVLGNDAAAVGAFVAGGGPGGTSTFEKVRTEYFPEAESFAIVDLVRFGTVAGARREALAARLKAKPADIDALIALAGLFRSGFAVSEVATDFRSAHRRLGLLIR